MTQAKEAVAWTHWGCYTPSVVDSIARIEWVAANVYPELGAGFTLRGVLLGIERSFAGKGTETRLELLEQEALTLQAYKEWLIDRRRVIADECVMMIKWIRLAKEQAIDTQDFERAACLRDYEKWALAQSTH